REPERPTRQPSPNGNEPQPAKAASFSNSLPGYLQPTPLWKRALVPAFVVVVLLFWIGLLIYGNSSPGDSSSENEQVAQDDSSSALKSEQPTTPPKSPTTNDNETNPANNTPEPMEKNPPAPMEQTDNEPKIAINEEPPPDMEEKPTKGGEEVAVIEKPELPPKNLPNQPMEENPAKPAEPMAPEATNPPMGKPVDIPANAPQILYSSKQANSVTKGMLLRYDSQKNEWGTLPYRSFVRVGEPLACPDPLDAVLNVGDTGCEVTFIGGVLASFELATPPAAFGLNISQGQFVIARSEGEDATPLIITLEVGEDLLLLELTKPNTRCGIEIVPRFPNQFEQGLGTNWYQGQIWVERGQIRLLDRNEIARTMVAKQTLDLTPNEVPAEEPQPKPPAVQTVETLPAWLNPEGRVFKNLSAHYLRQFHSAFESAPLGADISETLRALVRRNDTPPAVAVMEAKTLAMLGYLQDVADLLAMHESKPEEIRKATIEGARRWLTLHPTKVEGQPLRAALVTNFNQENEQTADDVYRLLWGYRKSDLQDEATAIQLVNWLDHKDIIVRTLAFMHLVENSGGQTHKYRPLQDSANRQESIERWRENVKNGGLFD
ncbi:MAG: hypothetical protein KDA84_17080, partial [Planctomycetaceae bacterium]|nr:hypothetical protein [Planctomycetaceae bacterium]